MKEPRPFEIKIEESVLSDLRTRLAHPRWPDQLENTGWEYGTDLAYLRDLCEHWRTGYDWRAREAALNEEPHFLAEVEGSDLHFVHRKGRGRNNLPLLLVHGWPQSFYEFFKLIRPLSEGGEDGSDAFDVVVVSLPGFTFSPPARAKGMSAIRMASLLGKLMTETLGYQRFAVAGEDWGATVAARIAFDHPDKVVGLHVNMPTETPHADNQKDLTEVEQKWLKEMGKWRASEAAYWAIQSTKPQTLAYGLSDSPIGLAAWLVEKFRAWTDCDGDLERVLPRDELLTNLTLYWVTNCINAANRIYLESARQGFRFAATDRIRVPTAVTRHPKELVRPPREWIERVYDLKRLTDMPRGGHFPSQECPELVVADLRAFFATLR